MSHQPFIYTGGSQQVPKDIVRAQIHPSVKRIEPNAFSDCKELRYVEFSTGLSLEVIGSRAFYRCVKLTFVRLSDTTTKIEMAAFRQCKKLKFVIFNDKLEELGPSAFAECKSLQHLSFASSTRLVSKGAFLGCLGLETVAFNSSLEKVESLAFWNCPKLKLIVMPSEVPFLMSNAVPVEAAIEDTIKERFWSKVMSSAREAEAEILKKYGFSSPQVPPEDDDPENDDTTELTDHASELEAAIREIEMLKGLVSDLKREAKKNQEELQSTAEERDALKEEVANGRKQLEDALILAEELQEELAYVDEQRNEAQGLLETALNQRDELAKTKRRAESKERCMADFKEFEEHVNFVEAQAEHNRNEFEKTAKECSALLKENAVLKKQNMQLERVMDMRNKEYMDLLAKHVEAQLQIMGSGPEQLVMQAINPPATPTTCRKKKTLKKKKKSICASPRSPSKSPSSRSSRSSNRKSTSDTLKKKKVLSNIPALDLTQGPSEPDQVIVDDALSTSEFGDDTDKFKVEQVPLVVDVMADETQSDDELWDVSSQKSFDSCHKRIDWVGQIHETVSTSTDDDLLEQ